MATNYWNGAWTCEPITVPASDLTVLRGFGVFDFLRTYRRSPPSPRLPLVSPFLNLGEGGAGVGTGWSSTWSASSNRPGC